MTNTSPFAGIPNTNITMTSGPISTTAMWAVRPDLTPIHCSGVQALVTASRESTTRVMC